MTFTKLPKALTAEELLSTPLPPVKWIIAGLLPAGLALLDGPSNATSRWRTRSTAFKTVCSGLWAVRIRQKS